jgi:hypothetical protein
MTINRTYGTLCRMLTRIVSDTDHKAEWIELLGELYNAAAEHLDLDDGGNVTISVPLAVAEDYWRSIGAFHPSDARHQDNYKPGFAG